MVTSTVSHLADVEANTFKLSLMHKTQTNQTNKPNK
jgi:hypothetical protein